MFEPSPEHRLAEALGTCVDRLNGDATLGVDDVLEDGTEPVSELRDALQMLLDLREAVPRSPEGPQSTTPPPAVVGPSPGGSHCSQLSPVSPS